MTTHWRFLVAVTLITLTLSRANAVPATSLQRKDVNQDLGPTSGVLSGDLGIVGLKRRDTVDGLSNLLDTNGLYDGLTDTRKRSPLVFDSPVSVGGSSQSAPGAKTGGIGSKKRSPLLFDSPVAVGGSSKSAPGTSTGGIGSKKRSPLVWNSPVSLGGSSKSGSGLQTGTVGNNGNYHGSDSRKRSPLVGNSPISIGGDSKSGSGLQTGGVGGDGGNKDSTDSGRKSTDGGRESSDDDSGDGVGTERHDSTDVNIQDSSNEKKRSPLLTNSPVSVGGDSESAPAAQTGGLSGGLGGLGGLLKRDKGGGGGDLLNDIPFLGGGKGGDNIMKDIPFLGGGKDGGGDILKDIPFLGGKGGKDGNPLQSLTKDLPIKRLVGGLLGGDGQGGGGLGGLTSDLPLGLKRDKGGGDLLNDIPFLGGGKGGDNIMKDIPFLGGGKDGGGDILKDIPFLGGKGGKDGNPLQSLTKDLPIKRLVGGLLGGDGQGGGGLGSLTSDLPLGLKREHHREHDHADEQEQGSASGGGLLGLDGLTEGLPLLGQGGPLSGLTSSLPIKRKHKHEDGSEHSDEHEHTEEHEHSEGDADADADAGASGGLGGLTEGLPLLGQGGPLSGLTSSLPLPIKRGGGSDGLDISGLTNGITQALQKEESQIGSEMKQLPIGGKGDKMGKEAEQSMKQATNDFSKDSKQVDGQVNSLMNQLSKQFGGDLKGMKRRKRSASLIEKRNSESEAPSDLPNGRTQKDSSDTGVHLLGGDGDAAKLKMEETSKDATNNHGSDKDKSELSSSVGGGHKPTKLNLEHKNKEKMTGHVEGTKDRKSDVGLQTGGGHGTGLDVKKSKTKKTDHQSRG
ncbi:uncharacterized protein FA14DRAFT_171766 [Meira miltonrushii]|uniref:Uncharacterized protein n=1 Tax=Meira miltonrushii TaxID=1280837 RepID=A0A316VCP3_9BASI|nr:uncharacterized protein FA14DRAFT_171766 [Meira miltonrushii]PWN35074.1 hypothetical protein FA14DRAFT_171766 [Meira miltonrushii]